MFQYGGSDPKPHDGFGGRERKSKAESDECGARPRSLTLFQFGLTEFNLCVVKRWTCPPKQICLGARKPLRGGP